MTLDAAIARLKFNPADKSLLNEIMRINRDVDKRAVDSLAEELAKLYSERKAGLVSLAHFAEEFDWIELYNYCDSTLAGAYGLKLNRRELFAKLKSGDYAAARDPILSDVRANLPCLVLSLLLLDGIAKNPEHETALRCEALLPPSMRTCWETYAGRKLNIDVNGYTALWSYVVQYGRPDQVARLGDFAVYISTDMLKRVIADCVTWEQWCAGLHIVANVPATHELAATAAYWLWATKFMYHTGERECAALCAGKAAELGDASAELKSYKQWATEG